jgi:hypothetical protein
MRPARTTPPAADNFLEICHIIDRRRTNRPILRKGYDAETAGYARTRAAASLGMFDIVGLKHFFLNSIFMRGNGGPLS